MKKPYLIQFFNSDDNYNNTELLITNATETDNFDFIKEIVDSYCDKESHAKTLENIITEKLTAKGYNVIKPEKTTIIY